MSDVSPSRAPKLTSANAHGFIGSRLGRSVVTQLGLELNLRADICEKRDRHFSRNARISWSLRGLIR
jgi:hypothetical protein